jgi:hypothetical protein
MSIGTHAEPDDQTKDLVIRIALQDPSWMRHPEMLSNAAASVVSRITVWPIPAYAFFEGTRFFTVNDPTEKPGARSLVIAVARNGTAYPLRTNDDFQRLLVENNRGVTSGDEALEVAKQYAYILGLRYPRYWDELRFLSSSGEIPLKPGETIPDQLLAEIRPPRIQAEAGGFSIRLCTWTSVGGMLKCLYVQLSTEGAIKVTETLLGEGIGQAWLPK